MTPDLKIHRGDITELAVDAIVNAANERLAPGGGVCGAIHAAAGPKLAEACRALGGCPTGEARLTPGFDLPARYVIHAVGPIWQGGTTDEAEKLASAYASAIALAREHGLDSIAFPAISTGIYGYPLDQAARTAVESVLAATAGHSGPREVIFVAFDEQTLEALESALGELRRGLA